MVTFEDLPNDTSTDELNLYFPLVFYQSTENVGSDTARQAYADKFYETMGLRDKFPQFIQLCDKLVETGPFLDFPNNELSTFTHLMFAFIYTIDDLYEKHVCGDEPHAKFAVSLYHMTINVLKQLDKAPMFPKIPGISNALTERGDLFRSIIIYLSQLAEELMAPSHFRAWRKSLRHMYKYFVHHETKFRQLSQRATLPADPYQNMLVRSATAGQASVASVFLDATRLDLDNEFEPNCYMTQLSGCHVQLVNDLLSAAREIDEEDLMNHTTALMASGIDSHQAAVDTANLANQKMRALVAYHKHFPEERDRIYLEVRALYQVTRMQLIMERYGYDRSELD